MDRNGREGEDKRGRREGGAGEQGGREESSYEPDRAMTNQLCNERAGTLCSFRGVDCCDGKSEGEEWIDTVSDGD